MLFTISFWEVRHFVMWVVVNYSRLVMSGFYVITLATVMNFFAQ